MKIIVFGATGGTGRQFVEQALTAGHKVTAFLRDPAKLGIAHANLTIVPGNVMEPASVERALPGHDAVLVALGAPATKTGTVRSEGTRNIVRAMEKAGVRRLVCQTSLGYGDSRAVLDRAPFFFRNFVVPVFLRKTFADHALQEDIVKQSRLDWIIVRPGTMTDGPKTGHYRHGFPATDPTVKVEVSRADTADFMLKQVADDTYLGRTPGLSY